MPYYNLIFTFYIKFYKFEVKLFFYLKKLTVDFEERESSLVNPTAIVNNIRMVN